MRLSFSLADVAPALLSTSAPDAGSCIRSALDPSGRSRYYAAGLGSGGGMAGQIEARLRELGIELPNAAAPAANYVPTTISGNTLYVAGQVPFWNGELRHVGKLGYDYSIEQGQQAARLCALNIIAQAKAALDGDLDRVGRVLKLGAFVNCTAEFTDMPQVVNGASDLIVSVFGDKGKHARFAVGAVALPRGVAVEVDAVIEIA